MDFQRDIAEPGGRLAPEDPVTQVRFAATIRRAHQALVHARDLGMAVMHVRVALRPDGAGTNPHATLGRLLRSSGGVREGSAGVGFVDAMAPIDDEPVITKRMVSAFVGTDLDLLLRARDIHTVVLTGLVSHFVVEGTGRHAADLGYRVVTLGDACTSGLEASHAAAMGILNRLGEVGSVADFVTTQR